MLTVENLEKDFFGVQVLKGTSFKIKEGEIVGIIGPNGSGKTTLFNCISGFHYPKSGTVKFKGLNITDMRPFKRARLGLGRVFQNFGIFKQMTVLENIILAIESKQSFFSILFPWSKQHKINYANAIDLLKTVKLEDKQSQKASSLSGGQMRLLEITRAVAMGSELLLLDEPTAGVSPKMKDDVVKVIKKLKKDKKTVLVIEHDINFIEKFCDRIIVLDMGQVVLEDLPDKIKENKRLKEIYFGS